MQITTIGLDIAKNVFPLVDDVITAIDVERLARNKTSGIVGEERSRDTDIFDAD